MLGKASCSRLTLLGLLGIVAFAGCSSAQKKAVPTGGFAGEAGATDGGTSAEAGTIGYAGHGGGAASGGGEMGGASSYAGASDAGASGAAAGASGADAGASGADTGASGAAGSGGEAGVPSPLGGHGAIWVATGYDHTCVVLKDGAVRCWGDNQYSQLGQGPNTVDGRIGDDEPASALGPVNVGKPALKVAGGRYNSCAVLSDGAIRCWGGVALGYSPEQTIGDNETPASAGDVKVGGTVTALALGLQHSCALLSNQTVRCWGTGISHQLGYGNLGNIAEADTGGDVPIGDDVLQLAAGSNHTCAVLNGGTVRCWGNNDHGELGYARVGNLGMFETPASLGDVTVGGPVKQVTAGGAHTCALLKTGAVRCWGDNQYGQLGYGNTNNIGDDETPASAGDVSVGGVVVQLAAGDRHTCALLVGGTVRCWGWSTLGYPNSGTVGDDETPASMGDIDLGDTATQIAAGGNHTCALVTGGAVRCWGDAYKGALGYGTPLVGNIGDNETPASAGNVPF